MILLTGDTHGYNPLYQRFEKIKYEYPKLTKNDYVIVLGDIGIGWYGNNSPNTKKELKYIDNCPFTTLFIDGNHENFDFINAFEEIDMFDGDIGKISESFYYLQRGHIYNIENKTFFTMGGGRSIDKEYRLTYNLGWWEEEMPTHREFEEAYDNLRDIDFNIDYILTHEAPGKWVDIMINEKGLMRIPPSPLEKFLDIIEEKLNYGKWFFGHYHLNHFKYNKKYIGLYEEIFKLQ